MKQYQRRIGTGVIGLLSGIYLLTNAFTYKIETIPLPLPLREINRAHEKIDWFKSREMDSSNVKNIAFYHHLIVDWYSQGQKELTDYYSKLNAQELVKRYRVIQNYGAELLVASSFLLLFSGLNKRRKFNNLEDVL